MAVDVTLLNSNSLENIQTNFERVKTALQDTIGRSGSLPNQMNADLDMNNNDILNVDSIDLQYIIVDGEEFDLRQMRGWAPVFSAVEYNGTVVMKLIDYVGGQGIKPTQYIGWYVGSTGYVQNINQATGFGSSGVTDGDKGDITVSNSGTVWDLNKNFDTVSELLSDETMGYAGSGATVAVASGDIITVQSFRYEVAASGAADQHLTIAGGVKLYEAGFVFTHTGHLARVSGSDEISFAELTHPGREGEFVWNGSDLSAEVAVDTEQGIYVAPSGDATGASGAWVRRFDGAVMAKWFDGNLQVAVDVAALLDRDLHLGRKGDEYVITSGVTIPDDMRVFSDYSGGFGAKIDASSGNFTAITLGERVRLEGIEIEGPGNDAYNVASFGIFQTGTSNAPSAPTYAGGPIIEHCHIHGFRNSGIELRYVDGFKVDRCLIEHCGYNGLTGISVKNGSVLWTEVDDIFPGVAAGGGFNAYGIVFTKFNGDQVGHPKSSNVAVSHCEVRNVGRWHAFDTHGGDLIVFSDCIARNCMRGFIITAASDSAGGRYGAKRSGFVRCHAIEAPTTHAEKGQAFWFIGAANSIGTYVDYTEDCFMEECFADGYGEDRSGGSGPVLSIEGVRRLRIDGLTLINSVGRGILFGKDSLDFKIDGLTISDIYSDYRDTIAVGFNGNNVKGRITNYEMINTGITPGSFRNNIGFYSAGSLTGLQVSLSAGRNGSSTPTSYGTALSAYDT